MYKYLFKPLLDYLVAIVGIVLLLPIFLAVAILIKLESKGPVLFKQQRMGKNGRLFILYKFRSMTNTPRNSEKQVFQGDNEITKVGHYLRRLKIDELPQLFNILFGDLSLIGPRPSLPNLKEKFNEDGIYRIMVKPGCTNLAAVNGSIYLTWPERWVYDRYYVENLSFYLDIVILLKTILVVIFGEKIFLKKDKWNIE